MTSISRYQLFKLSKSNFTIWEYQIKNVFAAEKMSHLLTSKDDSQLTGAEKDNWSSNQGLGRTIIAQSLEQADLCLVVHLDTVFEIVDFFKNRARRSETGHNLNEEFVFLQWKYDESADTFIAKLTELETRMKAANVPVDETRFTQKLLSCLPNMLRDVANAYQRDDAMGKTLVYSEVKTTVLRLYDLRVKQKLEKAMVNRQVNLNNNTSSSSRPPRSYCVYCKRSGHLVDVCWRARSRRQNSSNNNNQRGQTHHTDNSDQHHQNLSNSSNSPSISSTHPSTNHSHHSNNSDPASVQLPAQFRANTCLSNQGKSEKWDFDTDCSRHMKPHLHHFQNITMIDGESYVTGNGRTQSKGVGSIKIKSFTGSQWIEMYLHDVQYVPTLPSPLFSEPACKPQMISDPIRGELKLLFDGQVLFTASRDPRLNNVPYVMNIRVQPQTSAML